MPNEPVTFVVFAGDLVTYALKKILLVDWRYPHQLTTHRKTFHATVGEAALVFRDRHADEFAERISDFPTPVIDDVESAVDYLEHFVGEHFKGRVPLMELLVYCAFLVDLCVCCVENDRTDLIDDIVPETYDVYADHVRPYFDVVGGWSALLQVARDYLDFVESMRMYSVLVATSNGGNKHTIHTTKFRDVKSIASTGFENNSATSTNIVSLETKEEQPITKTKSLDADYFQAITSETSSLDSDDLMSISSTESDGGNRRTIPTKKFRDAKSIACTGFENNSATSSNIGSLESKEEQSITKTNSLDADYFQAITSETSSIDSEDLMSISSTESVGRRVRRTIKNTISCAENIEINEPDINNPLTDKITLFRQLIHSKKT